MSDEQVMKVPRGAWSRRIVDKRPHVEFACPSCGYLIHVDEREIGICGQTKIDVVCPHHRCEFSMKMRFEGWPGNE